MRRAISILLLVFSALSSVALAEEAALAPVSRFTLDNGLEVWHLRRTESKSVAVGLSVRAGSRFEDPKHMGLSHFVEHMCFAGTERFDEAQLTEMISDRGGVWNAETQEERTDFWTLISATHFETAAEWVSQLVFHPTFPVERIDKERNVIFEEKGGKTPWLERKLDHLGFGGDVTDDVRKVLFPGSALAFPVIGDDKTLSTIDHDSVVAYHKARYVPNNAVLIVVGNVERERVERACAKYFADLPKGPPPPSAEEPKMPANSSRPTVIRAAAAGHQGAVMLAVRTTGAKDADCPAMEVLGELLRQSLAKELQFERGIVYDIDVENDWFCDAGCFTLVSKAKRSNVKRVQEVMQTQIDRIRRGEVDAQKVESAKTSFNGQWELSLEGNYGWMDWLESLAFLYPVGQPLPDLPSQVAAVKPEDLTRVVGKYFTPPRTCMAILGPIL